MKKIILGALVLGAWLFALTPITEEIMVSPAAENAETSTVDVEAVEVSSLKSTPLTAAEILQRIDDNRLSDGKIAVMSMTIHGRRGDRTISAKVWQRNIQDSFTEYLAPAREKGTKMLKLGDQLWTYAPDTDRTILISGHMLRQSVMGSDMSYEDMLEDPVLANNYSAAIAGEETLDDRPVWALELTAKKDNLAYAKRRLWVDQERFITLKENLYAKSGALLKTLDVTAVMQVDGRWLAKAMIYKDALKKDGSGTSVVIESLEFNDNLPEALFSKASLRK
ncbi:MAG: outer membrane lipoprotein-sorting protein [Candidatus Margulisbacteria bacterium]|jgi:outer membrane lipoprotein-sorting protein|nr:outer membrane lipoprotein-sorting protein [Candidatus Margulisiibacteriota bacterium]